MKAITCDHYGEPESVLHISEVPRPIPEPEQVLIKVHATTVNDYDWCLSRGRPFIYSTFFGLKKPKYNPGMELAGVVEALGSKVTRWKVGDAVFCDTSNDQFGTFAEYICLNEKTPCRKPKALSFCEAAVLPHAAALAWQGLKDLGRIRSGQQVLVNGAGGGVGTIAIQIAKKVGCEVTAVDSAAKLSLMQSMGADKVIDYQSTDFTREGRQYDLILDCKASKSPFDYARALKPKGLYVSIGGTVSSLLKLVFCRKLVELLFHKKILILALQPNKDLEAISDFFIEHKFRSYIDGPCTLADLPSQVARFGRGDHQGKVVAQLQ